MMLDILIAWKSNNKENIFSPGYKFIEFLLNSKKISYLAEEVSGDAVLIYAENYKNTGSASFFTNLALMSGLYFANNPAHFFLSFYSASLKNLIQFGKEFFFRKL